jgi:hypothetical protein
LVFRPAVFENLLFGDLADAGQHRAAFTSTFVILCFALKSLSYNPTSKEDTVSLSDAHCT